MLDETSDLYIEEQTNINLLFENLPPFVSFTWKNTRINQQTIVSI